MEADYSGGQSSPWAVAPRGRKWLQLVLNYTYFFPWKLVAKSRLRPTIHGIFESRNYVMYSVLAMIFYLLRYLFYLKAVDFTYKFRGDRGNILTSNTNKLRVVLAPPAARWKPRWAFICLTLDSSSVVICPVWMKQNVFSLRSNIFFHTIA
jgi:hypothetical protein